jgi:hypothetical protein
MKRSSAWTIALAATTVLTTAVWAQHGGGAGGHGGPPSVAAHGQSHAEETASTKDADKDSDRSADFESRLASNSKLSSRLQSLLPPNTKLQTAASGFKSQGQFIAALHVSHNLNIPFDQLKTEMITKHDSLGAAIRDLRPDLDSKQVTSNVKLAERQAKTDVQESNEIAESSGK